MAARTPVDRCAGRVTNFLRAISMARKRAADERAVRPHRVPTMLDAADIGLILAHVASKMKCQMRLYLPSLRPSGGEVSLPFAQVDLGIVFRGCDGICFTVQSA